MIKHFMKESWLLIIASLFFGILLAGTNTMLAPKIRQNQIEKFNSKARKLIDGATTFENVEESIKLDSGEEVNIKKALDESGNLRGWAFAAEGSGFADKIKLVIAVDPAFETIKGYGVLSSNETPGFGDKIGKPDYYFAKQFAGTPAEKLTLSKTGNWKEKDSEIIAVSGATITSDAVVSIFNDYIVPLKSKMQEKGLL